MSRTESKARRAHEMAGAGFGSSAIARELGCSRMEAWRLVHRFGADGRPVAETQDVAEQPEREAGPARVTTVVPDQPARRVAPLSAAIPALGANQIAAHGIVLDLPTDVADRLRASRTPRRSEPGSRPGSSLLGAIVRAIIEG